MDELDKVALNGLDRYYNMLINRGYLNNTSTLKLLYVVLMSNFMNSLFSQYIDDKDYKCIMNSLNCMSDCMIDFIDYPTFKDGIEPIYNTSLNAYRITEDDLLRLTENNNIRIV